MVDWLRLFREISEKILQEVKPIFGSEKAGQSMGRNAGGDISKYIDLLAEDIVIKTLEAKECSCTLISEECGMRKIGMGGQNYVVLDSIDGTTNATRNIPFVSVSIAHASSDLLKDVDVALVKDLYNNMEFIAMKRKGAFENGKPTSSSTISSLGESVIAINLTSKKNLPELLAKVSPILDRVLKIRHMGSTALEICYVASGALDAFIDLEGLTRSTDLAAAYLILKESGGVTIATRGEELDMPLKASARTQFISAANKAISDEILNCLKSSTTKTLSTFPSKCKEIK